MFAVLVFFFVRKESFPKAPKASPASRDHRRPPHGTFPNSSPTHLLRPRRLLCSIRGELLAILPCPVPLTVPSVAVCHGQWLRPPPLDVVAVAMGLLALPRWHGRTRNVASA